jgi:hypothetical protein
LEICNLILQRHDNSPNNLETLPRMSLISHARFLYMADWKNPGNVELWFTTTTNEFCKGSSLYFEPTRSTNSSKAVWSLLRPKYPFVHNDYLAVFPQGQSRRKWLEWLCRNFYLSPYLRLVSPLHQPTFYLSDDFRFIFDSCPTPHVLCVLMDNWSYYSEWIEENGRKDELPETKSSRRQVRKKLAEMKVRCKGGHLRPLRETCLPLIDRALDSFCAPSLDIDNPESPRWQNLVNFGVIVSRGVPFYILCLSNIQGSQPKKTTVIHIYQQLQVEVDRSGDVELVRYMSPYSYLFSDVDSIVHDIGESFEKRVSYIRTLQ